MPIDLTVDVGVVMAGSGLGDLVHATSSLELMKAIESRPNWALAFDSRNRIKHQYEEMIKQGFGRDWLRRLATRGRIIIVPWERLNRGIQTALKEEHFDPEDRKYVETAAKTETKVLVSHDPDYSNSVRRIIRRIHVYVASASEALAIGPEN